ncbi:sensor histidine kinase [Candidatus Avelusimicrobium caledoniensis]|uniref:sensor histidine kinase n=1 Tax=Candidatus Avelusimicrobium caledoniensis TaxID=3416220 RepID=UPI003D152228
MVGTPWQMVVAYVVIIASSLSLLTYWITKKFVLRKMNRTIMKAEHNYQQQIASLQMQLSGKVTVLEGMVNKLRLSNQELTRLNEIRSKFMSIVAHDLRQPLSSIQGFASVLMMDGPQGSGNNDQIALNNILKATDNMNMLMADLMDISMIESGRFKMDGQPFTFNTLVSDVVTLQAVNAQKKGIFLQKYDYPKDITVTADRFRLSQVLSNLIGNAIKFAPQGGRVEVSYYDEDPYLVCRVSDNGPGILHTEKEKIFQKFHQSDNNRNLKKQGWGLGLSIAQEIVNAHGGEIGVESAGLGQGAMFWFAFPKVPVASPAKPTV